MAFAAVAADGQQTPYAGSIAIPGTLQAENYDRGGNGIAWSDTSPGNAFGVYRSDDMDVGSIPAGGYHIGGLAGGEWAEYTVAVAAAGTYDVTLRWASDYAGTTNFRLYQNGVLLTPTAIAVEKTSGISGDWHSYRTRTFPVNLTAGTTILKVEFAAGAWNFDHLVFARQTCPAPSIPPLPSSVRVETPGQTWTYRPAVTGAVSYQWYRDGVAMAGETDVELSLPQVEEGKDVGNYTLKAWSSCGSMSVSNAMNLWRVRCSASPGHASENLHRALARLPDYCYWQEDRADAFVNNGTDTNGSYNRPVIAGAIAYIKGYAGYDLWWDKYLRGELGKSGGAANWVYGGNEIGSFTYQQFNTISVMAVALHAHRMTATDPNAAQRRDLALEWLRNTFSLNALAAAPMNVLTMHAQGQFRYGSGYSGPYVTMAGERSNYVNWDSNDRNILFAEAAGLAHNGQGETPGVRTTRRYIAANWPLSSPGPFGLTATQQSALRAIVSSGTLPSNFAGGYVSSTLRTKMPYHFVGWQSPQVVRLTLMERNNHTWTAPTYGAVYFTGARNAGGREVHLLWPWSGLWVNDNYKHSVTRGTGTLNLAAGYVEAEQPGSADNLHPYMKVRIDGLPPASSRGYWVTLSPNAPPAIR